MNDSRKRVLLVASDWPWPPNYSARIDVLDRLVSLNRTGCIVDLVVTAGQHIAEIDLGSAAKLVNKCFVVRRLSGLLDMAGTADPGQVWSRRTLESIEFKDRYDLLILEGHYVSRILRNDTLKATKTALRVNNNEATYFLNLAKSQLSVSSLYYLLESIRFHFSYLDVQKKADYWLFSSAEDYESSRLLATKHGKLAMLLPPRVEATTEQRRAEGGVLFVGTFLVPNNVEAVKWYLDHVHDQLLSVPGYRLTLAGRMKSRSAIDKIIEGKNKVVVVPNPESIETLYNEHAVFINPMRSGAGIKMKTVHAIAAGLPVVTTSIGAQGTLMRNEIDFLVRDQPLAFTSAVRMLLGSPIERKRLVESAGARIATVYNPDTVIESVLSSC